ncbi:MAG: hypothetical protein ACJ8D9_18955, partial [Xanthobacteraceae bacterium]
KSYVMSQYLADRRRFERVHSPTLHEATITETALNEFEERWRCPKLRLEMIPGKEALSALNQHLQEQYGINVTPTAIIDAMRTDEVPAELEQLVRDLSQFAASKVS